MEKQHLLHHAGASADIYRYGAHLTSWKNKRGHEWLFLSKQAKFEQGAAIRGGVPIIFPQFNAFGEGPRHGFARTSFWQFDHSNGSEHCCFSLVNNEHSQSWPHTFRTLYSVTLTEDQITLELQVRNNGTAAMSFTCALHTYLAVDDIHTATVSGLQGLSYWDNDGSDFTQRRNAQTDELRFNGPLDRVYFNYQKPLTLNSGQDRLSIAQQGFEDVVIWNPGAEAAKAMNDLDDNEFREMLCVEAARIDRPVVLDPGATWSGSQILTSS